jgi:hypothetical protein
MSEPYLDHRMHNMGEYYCHLCGRTKGRSELGDLVLRPLGVLLTRVCQDCRDKENQPEEN